MNSSALFSKTPPLKLFFLASIPGAVSMLASALYQTIDGVFVGRFLGATAFAAINLAMPFVIINFSLADLVGVGSAVPISICLGKKQEHEANNIFTCACLMIIGAGVLLGSIMFASSTAADAAHGCRGNVRRSGGTIPEGLCTLLAGNNNYICLGQLPAHLRVYPRAAC